jgi:hypothetical protein
MRLWPLLINCTFMLDTAAKQRMHLKCACQTDAVMLAHVIPLRHNNALLILALTGPAMQGTSLCIQNTSMPYLSF